MKWKIKGYTIDEITHSEALVYECSNCKSVTLIPAARCFFCKDVSEKLEDEEQIEFLKRQNHAEEASVGWL